MSALFTEAEIEVAAEAAYAVRAKHYGFEFDWQRAGPSRKEAYRAEVKAALEAVARIRGEYP